MNSTVKLAKRTLINNRRSKYTLPTNSKLYPAQWNWDSAFIALGYSNFNSDYSFEEIETLLSGQWKDGMIPHILFHIKDENYTPNYKAWDCGQKVSSSGITQPPILASVLRLIIERKKFLPKHTKRYYSHILKIKKCLEWFIKYRDPEKTGLISILHPWESGYDNSPLWDKPMSKIKIDPNLNYKRKDNKIIKASQRPLKIDYDRYVSIKNHLKKMNYDPKILYYKSKFNVVDIGFNSLFLKALKDLNFLLNYINKESSFLKNYIQLNEKNLIKLYNSKKMKFKNKDLKNNALIEIPSITNFFMLFSDLKNKSVNKSLIKSLKRYCKNEEYLFPSISSSHKLFEEKRYWRGPVWINCNWIIYQGLKNKDKKFAEIIRKNTIKLVEKKKFREYYSCKSGSGMGAKNFSWSAALYLDFILNRS